MTNDLKCIYGESYKVIPVNPVMAYALGGANDAMVFTQIDYWLEKIQDDADNYADKVFRDGYWWTYQAYSKLMKQLPFLSKKTIQNIINRLEAKGVLVVGRFGQGRFNSTNYYRIDYNRVDELYQAAESEIAEKVKNADSDKRGWQKLPPRKGSRNYHQERVAKSTTNREYNLENKHKESNTKLAVNTADDADDFNFSFLDQEVYKVCREMSLPLRYKYLFYDIMDKYYQYYHGIYGYYKRIGYDAMLSSFERLQSAVERNGIEWEDVPKLIPLYFSDEFREYVDYGFPHFCSDGVLDILIRKYKRECIT